MLLNQAAKVIDTVKISRGGLASTQVDVRCILREALLKRATSMILCHNHPSGNIRPSQDDDRLTHALLEAARTMNIRFARPCGGFGRRLFTVMWMNGRP